MLLLYGLVSHRIVDRAYSIIIIIIIIGCVMIIVVVIVLLVVAIECWRSKNSSTRIWTPLFGTLAKHRTFNTDRKVSGI